MEDTACFSVADAAHVMDFDEAHLTEGFTCQRGLAARTKYEMDFSSPLTDAIVVHCGGVGGELNGAVLDFGLGG